MVFQGIRSDATDPRAHAARANQGDYNAALHGGRKLWRVAAENRGTRPVFC